MLGLGEAPVAGGELEPVTMEPIAVPGTERELVAPVLGATGPLKARIVAIRAWTPPY
jgi:hypothetical protein